MYIRKTQSNWYTFELFFGILWHYHLQFRGSKYDFIGPDGYTADRQSAYTIEPIIRIKASNSMISGCEFTDIEGGCIGFYNAVTNSSASNNHFHNIGCYSCRIGENHGPYDKEEGIEPEWDTTAHPVEGHYKLCEHITVENNIVAHYGELFEQSAGIIMWFSKNCSIEHNDVIFGFYTGITAGYCWDDKGGSNPSFETDAHYIRGGNISYNRVAYISGGLLCDCGCLYVLGRTHGLLVNGNYLSYVYSTNSMQYAIYSDGIDVGTIFKDNRVFNTQYGLINNMRNWDIDVIGNAFTNVEIAYASKSQNKNVKVKGNIFSQNTTKLYNNVGQQCVIDGNIWFSTAGSISVGSFDTNPVYGNPNFANSANGDFHVIDDTYTSQIGWEDKWWKAGVLNKRQQSIVKLWSQDEEKYKSMYP